MKWIGQHIYDLVARFRNDVYLEDLSTTTETNVLVVDSDGKVSKTTVITGDVTGVTAGSNITVTNPTGPVPTVALNTSLTGLDSVTSTSFIGSLTGNADTVTTNADLTGDITSSGNATTIASGVIINDDINASAGIVDTKLATISTASKVSNSATTATNANTASAIVARDASGNFSASTITAALTGNAATATKISSITNTNIVQLTSPQTLTFKTLSAPAIQGYARFLGGTSGTTLLQATAVAGSTTLTLPAATDTLVGKDTADILTNKTLTAPTITGAGAIAGVFTGNITGDVTGNADTVTTNADLTGPVTSTGNTTAIADGAITTAMQKHLQTFEFNGYSTAPASTNYFIPTILSVPTGPFNHNVDAGASGTTALLPTALFRSGGKVMPYAGTCKLWKGWVGVNGNAAFNISIFKYTPVPDDATPDSLVLVKNFSDTAVGNNNLIAISEDDGFVNEFDAGDILITGISCESGKTVFFTSTLEVEWN
jgi:hypothetical protein